jgi:hypothetical protein
MTDAGTNDQTSDERRRQAFLAIHDLSTQLNLPMPQGVTFSRSGITIRLDDDTPASDVQAWADALGLGSIRDLPVPEGNFTSVRADASSYDRGGEPAWLSFDRATVWSADYSRCDTGEAGEQS